MSHAEEKEVGVDKNKHLISTDNHGSVWTPILNPE